MITENDDKKRAGAFFDLDLTITDRDSFRYFLKEYYLHESRNWHFIPQIFFWALMRKAKLVSLQTFKEEALVSLRGKEDVVIQQIGQNFFENHLIKILRKKALAKIKWHKKKGHCIYIVTSCPDIYMQVLVQYMTCDGYECTKLAYRNKKFLGGFEGKDCLGIEKVERLNAISADKQLDLSASFAYSDHESDIPMLELVGHPVAICPTSKLREIAKERNWVIEEW